VRAEIAVEREAEPRFDVEGNVVARVHKQRKGQVEQS
jgi:hypothetical protein